VKNVGLLIAIVALTSSTCTSASAQWTRGGFRVGQVRYSTTVPTVHGSERHFDWQGARASPALSARAAVYNASVLLPKVLDDVGRPDWQLKVTQVQLCQLNQDAWVWVVGFGADAVNLNDESPECIRIIVMMNGSTLKPERRK